jgi:hypothetical protein
MLTRKKHWEIENWTKANKGFGGMGNGLKTATAI